MGRPRGSLDRAATRERILAAAEHAFANGGYHATSLQQVAEAAGMRAPSLLYHFGSKEVLFDEVMRRAYRRIEEPLLRVLAPEESPRTLLTNVLDVITAFEADHHDLLGVLNAEVLGPGRHGIAAVRDTMLPLVERIEAAVRSARCSRIPAKAPLRQALLHIVVFHAARVNLKEIGPELLGSVEQERALAGALLETILAWPGSGAES